MRTIQKYLLVILLVISQVAMAQDSYDAWKFAQQDLFGTARYVGMSGAFLALGGDPSAVKDNPAALGVFRKSDFSITLDLAGERTYATWGASPYTERNFRVSCGQANAVVNFNHAAESGLVSNSFMLGYNRIKNFNRDISVNSVPQDYSMTDYMANFSNGTIINPNGITNYKVFDDINVAWLSALGYDGYLLNATSDGQWSTILGDKETVTPQYRSSERGFVDDWNLAWGGNVSNRFYFGLGATMRLMEYSKEITYTEFFEKGGSFDIVNNYKVSGVGFSGVFGLIYRPVDMLRIAVSYQTPTLMNYREKYYGDLYSIGVLNDENKVINQDVHSPETELIKYQLTNPMRVSAGVAATFSNRALLSVQYDFEPYSTMKYLTNSGNTNGWKTENELIRKSLKSQHSIRVGGELFISEGFALRAGYMVQLTAGSTNPQRYLVYNTMRTDTEYALDNIRHYIGAGLGFRNNIVLVDLAYQYRITRGALYPFPGSSMIDLDTSSHRVVFTFGIR
ncbi:MAG: outer membrane protein transport protein [Paludibacteraceae bacterium]|nr:outer membrane protein transport protein [Paludibacteraceae bacterium]